MRLVTFILALLGLLPSAVSSQTLTKLVESEWTVPPGVEVRGLVALDSGSVALWSGGGEVFLFDERLRLVERHRIDEGVAGLTGTSVQDLDVLTRQPVMLRRRVRGTWQAGESGAGLPDGPVDGAVNVDGSWFGHAGGVNGSGKEARIVRLGADGRSLRTVIAGSQVAESRLSRVGSALALTRRTGPMSIELFDGDGRLVQRLEPRMSVVDSLTFGRLGIPGSTWGAGPAVEFFDGGVVQPIADPASRRTIMMLYSRDGVPVGWPLMRGATIEFFSLDTSTATILALVGYDGERRIQFLRWNRAR